MLQISKDYVIAPMTSEEAADWQKFLRETVIREAEEKIELLERHGVLDAIERRRILDEALRCLEGDDVRRQQDTQKRILKTDRGSAYLLYLHLRRHDAHVTPQIAARLFLSTERAKVLETMERVNGLGDGNRRPQRGPAEQGDGEYSVGFSPNAETARHAQQGGELPPEEQRKSVFDEMCRRRGVTPDELVEWPIGDAVMLYGEVTGQFDPDRMKLKKYLIEHAAKSKAPGKDEIPRSTASAEPVTPPSTTPAPPAPVEATPVETSPNN